MKKLTFVLASLMLCLAVTLTSCGKKNKAADNSADEATSESVSEQTPVDEANAILDELQSAITNASSVEELEAAMQTIGEKMNKFNEANPNFEPTQELKDKLAGIRNLFNTRYQELGGAMMEDPDSVMEVAEEEVVEVAPAY